MKLILNNNLITIGKISYIDQDGHKVEYEGELKAGKPCGWGVSSKVDRPGEKFEGTYFNGMRHGLCMLTYTSIYK